MYGGGYVMWLFWVALIVVLVYLVSRTGMFTQRPPISESALDILKKRYAAGEITREEYERMKQDIR